MNHNNETIPAEQEPKSAANWKFLLVITVVLLLCTGMFYKEASVIPRGIQVRLTGTTSATTKTQGYWLLARPTKPYDESFQEFLHGFEAWSSLALYEPGIAFELALNDVHSTHDGPCISISARLDSKEYRFNLKDYYHEQIKQDRLVVTLQLIDAWEHSSEVLTSLRQLVSVAKKLKEATLKHSREVQKM